MQSLLPLMIILSCTLRNLGIATILDPSPHQLSFFFFFCSSNDLVDVLVYKRGIQTQNPLKFHFQEQQIELHFSPWLVILTNRLKVFVDVYFLSLDDLLFFTLFMLINFFSPRIIQSAVLTTYQMKSGCLIVGLGGGPTRKSTLEQTCVSMLEEIIDQRARRLFSRERKSTWQILNIVVGMLSHITRKIINAEASKFRWKMGGCWDQGDELPTDLNFLCILIFHVF